MRRHQIDELAPIARAFADAFTQDTRTDGEKFTRLNADAPEWMRDAVRDAHDGEMPNDWRYETCARLVDDLAEALERGNDPDDIAHEITDTATDVYNTRLYQWLVDAPGRADYVDDANAESGHADSLSAQVMAGQFRCIYAMTETLLSAIRDAAEDDA